MQDDFPLIKTLRIDEIGYSAKVIPPKVNGPTVERVEGKFLIDGDMDFKPLDLGLGDNFDFFDIEKVKFGDLAIDMNFIIDALGNINPPKLSFSPGALRFDFMSGEKKPGGGGFFGSFPLKWKGFGLLSSGLKLGDIDFVSIAIKNEFSIETEFFLTFELDMGSFGSLGSLLKDFKMELALAFGFNKGKFALELGMAFPSSPAGSLDISFQGVLELKAKKYELVQLIYKKATGEEGKSWGFRGVEVELKVFNVELPPAGKTGVYIFSDPGNIDAGVGWLLSTVVPKKGGSIDLRQLTLGQRVDPLPGIDTSGERISTQLVLEQLAHGSLREIERLVQGRIDCIAHLSKNPGAIVHPNPASDIGVQVLDFEVIGLPGIDCGRFQGGVAGHHANRLRLFEQMRGFGAIDDPIGGDFGQFTRGEDDGCLAVLKHLLNRRETAESVEEMVTRRGDQFLRLAVLFPGQPHPLIGRVPVQPHHLARHQCPPAKIFRRVKGQNRVANADVGDRAGFGGGDRDGGRCGEAQRIDESVLFADLLPISRNFTR